MEPLSLLTRVIATLGEWQSLRFESLRFGAIDATVLTGAAFVAVAIGALGWRVTCGLIPGRTHITLPALLPAQRHSQLSFVRHTPFAFFLIGLPFFWLALADPYTPMTVSQTSHPGRRIAILVDASLSMASPFSGKQLKAIDDSSFSANMAAAQYFVRMRMKGLYQDLIAFLEFGNESYVVTPFTSDYENVLLSIRMVGDVIEWQRFPDHGTLIMKAISQGVDLFKTYEFLNAAGNLMVIFSDGQDNNVQVGGMSLDHVLSDAVRNKVPVYMIRTAYSHGLYEVVPDKIWKQAIEQTGGRFYPAADEQNILQAIKEIDSLATGRIELKKYSVKEPRFSPFALTAVWLWAVAIALQLMVKGFRTFP